MGTVDHDADEQVGQGRIERLAQRVQDALGELAGAAKEGLMALSVGLGLGVLHELMEAEVDEVVGPRTPPDPGPDRGFVTATRAARVSLGGRRVPGQPPAGANRRR